MPNARPVNDSARAAIDTTSGSPLNRPANCVGASATARPAAPVAAKTSQAPVHAIRRAVAQSPAPTACPTRAVKAEPTLKAAGMTRNSRRAAMPKAATAAAP